MAESHPAMFSRTIRVLLSAAALSLAACGPKDDSNGDPFAQLAKDQRISENDAARLGEFIPPPEIARTFGLKVQDSRSEVVLLQPDQVTDFAKYQKALLTMLAGRQTNIRPVFEEAQENAATQDEQLRKAIERKPAAILVDPVNAKNLSHRITEATQAGIMVIGLQKDLTGCDSLVYCDEATIGQKAASLATEALKRKAAEESKTEISGRAVQLRGAENSLFSQKVAAGFEEALRSQSNIILVHDAPAGWGQEKVFHRFSEAVAIQKQFDILFAHSDQLALAASKAALQHKNRDQLLIIGADGLDGRNQGLDLLRTGEFDATIARPPLVDHALHLVLQKQADTSFRPAPKYEFEPVLVTLKNHATFSSKREFPSR